MVATLSLSPLVLATPTSTNLANQHEPKTKTMSKDSLPIATLKNCKNLDEVKQLHCRVLKRGYSSVELGEEAILLYLELIGFGLLPDKFTFPFVLSARAKSLACSEGA
ncbi:hypothetical protein EZV62_012787 [Acer yangbiense]|uniref:Uncharacterized protein n=1 Tax=Acer yangbiense TaxID=1000413 RepID=A0A5C7HX77_9ROSI|nr:hypothetical protein EZV62_012787 [Acer yangbiense]